MRGKMDRTTVNGGGMAPVGEMAPGCMHHTTPPSTSRPAVCILLCMAPVGEIEPGCEMKKDENTLEKTTVVSYPVPSLHPLVYGTAV